MPIEHVWEDICWLWSYAVNNHTDFANAPNECMQIEHICAVVQWPDHLIVAAKHFKVRRWSQTSLYGWWGQCPINQSKPVTPRRRWGIPTDASAAMAAHRRLSSTTWSNDDIDWLVNSLMLSLHDLRGLPPQRLPSTEPCSMIFGSISWRQTWPNHDNLWRSTA